MLSLHCENSPIESKNQIIFKHIIETVFREEFKTHHLGQTVVYIHLIHEHVLILLIDCVSEVEAGSGLPL